MTKDITQVVVDSFEVVKKWLKEKLMSTIPCYFMAETNKELEVFKLGHSSYCIKHPVLCRNGVHQCAELLIEEEMALLSLCERNEFFLLVIISFIVFVFYFFNS